VSEEGGFENLTQPRTAGVARLVAVRRWTEHTAFVVLNIDDNTLVVYLSHRGDNDRGAAGPLNLDVPEESAAQIVADATFVFLERPRDTASGYPTAGLVRLTRRRGRTNVIRHTRRHTAQPLPPASHEPEYYYGLL
jgi:hypothetical protein